MRKFEDLGKAVGAKADAVIKKIADFGVLLAYYRWEIFVGLILVSGAGYLARLFYLADHTDRPGYANALVAYLFLVVTCGVLAVAYQTWKTNKSQLHEAKEANRLMNRPCLDFEVKFDTVVGVAIMTPTNQGKSPAYGWDFSITEQDLAAPRAAIRAICSRPDPTAVIFAGQTAKIATQISISQSSRYRWTINCCYNDYSGARYQTMQEFEQEVSGGTPKLISVGERSRDQLGSVGLPPDPLRP